MTIVDIQVAPIAVSLCEQEKGCLLIRLLLKQTTQFSKTEENENLIDRWRKAMAKEFFKG